MSEIFHFLVVNFAVYLNRLVFITFTLNDKYSKEFSLLTFRVNTIVYEFKVGIIALYIIYVEVTTHYENTPIQIY